MGFAASPDGAHHPSALAHGLASSFQTTGEDLYSQEDGIGAERRGDEEGADASEKPQDDYIPLPGSKDKWGGPAMQPLGENFVPALDASTSGVGGLALLASVLSPLASGRMSRQHDYRSFL